MLTGYPKTRLAGVMPDVWQADNPSLWWRLQRPPTNARPEHAACKTSCMCKHVLRICHLQLAALHLCSIQAFLGALGQVSQALVDAYLARRVLDQMLCMKPGPRAPLEGCRVRQVSQALVDAYLARRVLDHLLGMELSQLLWRKLPGATSAGARPRLLLVQNLWVRV